MTEQRKPTIDCTPLRWGQIKAAKIEDAYSPEPLWFVKDERGFDMFDGEETWPDLVDQIRRYAEKMAYEYNRDLNEIVWTAVFHDPDLCNDDGTDCIFIRREIAFELVEEEDFGPYDGMNFYYVITVVGQDLGGVK